MPDCTVSDCNFSMSEKGTYQSFYLPKDEKLRSKWLHNMNRPKLMEISQNPKKLAVCIRHFQEGDFELNKKNKKGYLPKRKTLKTSAVPTLFMGSQKKLYLSDFNHDEAKESIPPKRFKSCKSFSKSDPLQTPEIKQKTTDFDVKPIIENEPMVEKEVVSYDSVFER